MTRTHTLDDHLTHLAEITRAAIDEYWEMTGRPDDIGIGEKSESLAAFLREAVYDLEAAREYAARITAAVEEYVEK